MKVLIDMNRSPQWKSRLAAAGIESEHWAMIGASTAPDSEIMSYAAANHYVVLTHDLDFATILAATHGEKPSVVQVRASNLGVEAIGDQIVSALLQMTPELEAGALLTIDSKRTRLRLLPLQWRG